VAIKLKIFILTENYDILITIVNLSRISFIQINYFMAVARHLSFTEAAKSLYTSQPTISRQISLLEQQIGVQLFERTKRSVVLTPAGSLLVRELSEINEKVVQVLEKTRNINLEQDGNLNIGFLEAMDSESVCGKVITEFLGKYPKIGLSLEAHSFNALRERLLNRNLDIIFTLSFEIDDALDIQWKSILRTNSCIIMSCHHPLANRDRVSLSDCRGENFYIISRDESPKAFDSVVSLCLKNGFTPNIIRNCPNVESLLLNVETGQGIALMDNSIRLHKNSNFKIIDIQDDMLDVVMARRRDSTNPAVQLFSKMMYAE